MQTGVMKKNNCSAGRLLFFLIILIVFVGLSCGGGKGSNSNSESPALEAGLGYLETGGAEAAKENFTSAIQADPESCPGHYGRVLADSQILFDKFYTYINLAGSLTGLASTYPQAEMVGMDLYALLEPFVQPFEELIGEVKSDTDFLKDRDCIFKFDSFPFMFGKKDDPMLLLELGGEWDAVEARIIGGIADFSLAIINFVLAHDLTYDSSSLVFSLFPSDVTSGITTTLGGFPSYRSLGALMEGSPRFLSKSSTRWSRFDQIHSELAEGIENFASVIPLLESGQGKYPDRIISFNDLDGDGFDSGDELSLGIVRVKAIPDFELRGRLRVAVPDYLSTQAVKGILDLFDRAKTSLEAVGQGGTGERIKLTELNPLLQGLLDAMLSPLPFSIVNFPPFPDALEFDLTAFFTNPKPLREFFPVWYDVGGGKYEFMIEAEVLEQQSSSADNIIYFPGDSPHFSGNYSIPADCVTIVPKTGGVTIASPVPYIAFQDPRFNGLLWLNLYTIQKNVSQCNTTDPEGYNLANQYSINKVLASFYFNYFNILSLLPNF